MEAEAMQTLVNQAYGRSVFGSPSFFAKANKISIKIDDEEIVLKERYPVTDNYVREGWVGYRVVARILQVDKRTERQKIEDELLSRSRSQSWPEANTTGALSFTSMAQIWYGPFFVASETEVHWVLNNEQGAETLAKKDEVVFLSVGEDDNG